MVKKDLHGIKHEDARREVIHFVEDHWDSEEPIYIVTGWSTKMSKIVKEVLDEYKLDYQDGDELGFNKGFIKVKLP